MEDRLEKWLYVYRKSYKFYSDASLMLSVGKFMFSTSSLTAFALLLLASLSIAAGILEIVDKSLQVSERKEAYKHAYKFYKSLLNSLRAKVITEEEALLKEQDLSTSPWRSTLRRRA